MVNHLSKVFLHVQELTGRPVGLVSGKSGNSHCFSFNASSSKGLTAPFTYYLHKSMVFCVSKPENL